MGLQRFQVAGAAQRDESDSLRRLVEKKISTDDYIRELERRITERRRQSENGGEQPSESDSRLITASS